MNKDCCIFYSDFNAGNDLDINGSNMDDIDTR